MSVEPLVVARKLRKSFLHMGNTLEVLKGIELTIGKGEVLSIVGASGAGKSTFLHCIGTLDVPTSGSLTLGGEELTELECTPGAGTQSDDRVRVSVSPSIA